MPYHADELKFAVEVLAKLEGARLRTIGFDNTGVRATWYEYVVLGTYTTSWNTYEDHPSYRYWYPHSGIAFPGSPKPVGYIFRAP